MKYERIKPAVFLERPNRFVAHVLLEGQAEKTVCHVKNTGPVSYTHLDVYKRQGPPCIW